MHVIQRRTTEQVDDYGYPLPPGWQKKLRKNIIRTSRSIVGKGIYLLLSIIGAFLWLSRLGKPHPPLSPATFHPRRILVIRLDLIGDLVLAHSCPCLEVHLPGSAD